MSESAVGGVVAPATNASAVTPVAIADGGPDTGFDRAAAFAEYQKVTDSDGDGVSRLDVQDFDPNAEPPAEAEAASEETKTDLTEEERLPSRAQKSRQQKE